MTVSMSHHPPGSGPAYRYYSSRHAPTDLDSPTPQVTKNVTARDTWTSYRYGWATSVATYFREWPHDSGWHEVSRSPAGLVNEGWASVKNVGQVGVGTVTTVSVSSHGQSVFFTMEGLRDGFVLLDKTPTWGTQTTTSALSPDGYMGEHPGPPAAQVEAAKQAAADASREFAEYSDTSYDIVMTPTYIINPTGENYWIDLPVKVPRYFSRTFTTTEVGDAVFTGGISYGITSSTHSDTTKGVWTTRGSPHAPRIPEDVINDPQLADTWSPAAGNNLTRFRIQASALGPPHYTMSGLDFTYAAATKVGYMLSGEPEGTDLVYNFAGVVE